jgi:hypothetical protein
MTTTTKTAIATNERTLHLEIEIAKVPQTATTTIFGKAKAKEYNNTQTTTVEED